MSEAWTVKRLGDVIVPCGTVDPTKEPDRLFRYVDVSGVSNETFEIVEAQTIKGRDAPSRARRQIRSGDVLFATIRPTLKRIAVVPPELDGEVCSTGYFVFRPHNGLDGKFLYYYLFTDGFLEAMEALQTGASYPAVNDAQVKDQKIAFPPLPEQKRIVAILDEAFAGIAAATANAEKNLANARVLFDTYLNSIFNIAPDNWRQKPLNSLVQIKHGFAFKSEYFADSGSYVLLTPGNFYEEGGYRDRGEKQKFYVGEVPDGFILDKGAFLIAMTEQAAGLLGSSIIVPDGDRFLHNQRLGLVCVRPGAPWCNEFFFHAFNTRRFRQAVHDGASGVKVRHTSPDKLGLVEVSFPESIEEQQRIAANLDALLAETRRLARIYKQKLLRLAGLKQAILQQAFSGELTGIKTRHCEAA